MDRKKKRTKGRLQQYLAWPAYFAAAVAAVLNGRTKDEVTVKLAGGDLRIQWDRKENVVYMTGRAETVFEGEIEL